MSQRLAVKGQLMLECHLLLQVNRMQLAFGMKVLLKNSNLDGNLKLVLRDVPKANR